MYWREQQSGMFSSEHIPILRFLNVINKKHNLYSIPSEEFSGLFKVAYPCLFALIEAIT